MIRTVRILAAAAVLVFCVQVFSDNKADVDLWGNVGFVTALPCSPEFHRANTFSFTEPDHPWINHEWLSQYLLHVVHATLGSPGLLLLKILIGLLLIALLNRSMCREAVSGPVRFFFLLMVVSTLGYGFSFRPHLATYLLYASFLFLLKYHAHRVRLLLFLLPLLGLLWTNLHGAFFIGLLLLLIFITVEAIKANTRSGSRLSRNQFGMLAVALILFLAATFLNPYGWHLWEFVFRSAAKPRPYLTEWAPFNPLAQFAAHIDFMALALLALLAVVFSRREKDFAWITILLVSFVAACWMRRNIPLFAITTAFVIPAHVDERVGKHLERMLATVPAAATTVALSLAIVMSAAFAVHFNKSAPLRIEVPQDRFPSGIIRFMETTGLSGNALVFFDWAEYSIWKLHPRCRIFLDGRFNDAYSDKVIDDYFNFLYLKSHWENALNNYPIDIVMIHRDNPVFGEMMQNQDWQAVGADRIAALFLKKSVHSAFLARLESGEVGFPPARKEVFFP